MLKYRGPLAAIAVSFVLLLAVILTRPPSSLPSTLTPAASVTTLPTATAAPSLTPAPTIPIQQMDTSTLNEAVITSSCVIKLNPLLAGYNRVDRDIASLIFEGLMKTDSRGAIIPALAAAQPTVSEDGLVYAVKLRSDVLWHDGQPFTSEDVAFTINTMQNSAFPGPEDLHRFWSTVEVDVIDPQTVRFKLAQPLATFTDYLRIGILPSHVLAGFNGPALRTHPFNLLSPIGTGPYQFDGLIGSDNQITGVRLRFAGTYAQRPEGQTGYAIRAIKFHCVPSFNEAIAAFQRGEVNTINLIPPEALAEIAMLPIQPLTAYRPAVGAVIYNWGRDQVAYFRDVRMRQALAHSLDREALIRQHLPDRAQVANGPVLPLSWAYLPGVTCPNYDFAKAQQSLGLVQIRPFVSAASGGESNAATAEATVAVNPDQPLAPADYTFQLLVSNDPTQAGLAEDIIKQWEQLGIRPTLVVVDKTTFRERLEAGNFDAAIVELNLEPGADPDPYSLWRQLPSEGGLNFGGLNERRLSELMENARREPNGIARAKLYQEFQKLFCERAAAVLLYNPVYFYGTDVRLTGVQIGFMSDPSDRFRTIQAWKFQGQ